VYHYDRRGRGDSGDTLPYAPQREIEDLQALIEASGGSASLFGMSRALKPRAVLTGCWSAGRPLNLQVKRLPRQTVCSHQ
jgi:hypothetical protein